MVERTVIGNTGGGAGVLVKVAVTLVAAFSVTVQAPVPEQPPPVHPEKPDSLAAVAVSVTAVPPAKLALAVVQVASQLMPAGEESTVPRPEPTLVTVSVWLTVAVGVKVARTLVAAFIVTRQVPVPEQSPPDQPVKVEPLAAEAVSVTEVPEAKLKLAEGQLVPQLMPAGEEVTVPLPEPPFEMVSA